MMRIAVIMTCFNRRELTLLAIRSAIASAPPNVALDFFVTDDGSTDGTAEAVTAEFPQVSVLTGNGHLYWNGGMRRAWKRARAMEPDFYLWLNDDLSLLPTALGDMILTWQRYSTEHPRLIVVGHTLDPSTAQLTYGGLKRAGGLSRLRFRHLRPTDEYCDTMNGNCVLIPSEVTDVVGINSPRYMHSFGDMDYGLRARRHGCVLVQCPSAVGYQSHNGSYTSPKSLRLKDLWTFATHPKGMPFKEWLYFCRQHGGWIWPINFLSMYLKPFFGFLKSQPSRD